MRGGTVVENLLADVKNAARMLWRSPAFAATAIAALAPGHRREHRGIEIDHWFRPGSGA